MECCVECCVCYNTACMERYVKCIQCVEGVCEDCYMKLPKDECPICRNPWSSRRQKDQEEDDLDLIEFLNVHFGFLRILGSFLDRHD